MAIADIRSIAQKYRIEPNQLLDKLHNATESRI